MAKYRFIALWLVAAAVCLMLAGCSARATESRYLAKGKREFQARNYAVAILHFKTASQAQPRDAEPYYQLGLVYAAANDLKQAARNLQKAVELNPKHTGAQLKLAELMAAGRTRELVEAAQKRAGDLLELLPGDIDTLNVLAFTELRLGKPESAEAHLQQALAKSPGDLKSSVALARVRLARQDVKGAEEALKEAAARAQKSPVPWVYLGGFYASLDKPAEAEQQFRHALEIDPRNGPALLALGAIQVRGGRTAEADRTYRQASSLPDRQYKAAHALFLFQAGKRDEAVAEFETLVRNDPANRTLRTYLVKAYLAVKRIGDAVKVLTAALKKSNLDADALLQRSQIYLLWGNYGEAQADLHQVLHFRNDSAEAHYLLAKVEQARGDTRMSQQELGEALRLDPSYLAARVERARGLIATGGAEAALALLDEAPEEQKSSLAFVVQRNWALLALGHIQEARKALEPILASGKFADARLQDALLKLVQKDYNGARVSAEAVLHDNPEDTRALGILLDAYSSQNQLPAGLAKAREQAASRPQSAPMQQFLGQLLLHNGDRAGARRAFEAAKAANPGLLPADLALAEMDIAEGKRQDARNRLSAVVLAHPDSFAVQMLWGELEALNGSTGSAVDHYRKALAIDSRNLEALNNLAYLLAEGKQPDEALKFAQQAKELAPDSPAVDDTLGWTYYQKGMYSLAVTHLQSAVARDRTARRGYHLAMAYLKAGDGEHGRQALDMALKIDPSLAEAQAARQLFGNNKR
jgi:tetratricopeptide (TPR) repeat protein